MASNTLTRRLDLRLADEEKRQIDRAAALAGLTTSGFVRQAVLAAAREAIQTENVVTLTLEGSRQFLAAIDNPPEPNENLLALARELGENARP